ncbi:hypothetical protein FGG08_006727 [Glutinoglossum americanum]|uniref:Uncharacterized protein n=1 Tax=Glutinoglossum americanum TaxID=1670608 RepID=A0A9P8HVF4_9PEZI|nr:hypothetical protein FGG08_006727 [Glutinoglossum americanum]
MKASAPLFPRPVSPIDTRPLSPTPSDVEASDSGPEINPEDRAAKRQRIERIAQQYLSGQQILILSAGLKGPFHKNWPNPWEKRRKSKQADGLVIDETPRCAAAPERKKRKTQEGTEAATHDALAGRGTTRVNSEKERALLGDGSSLVEVGVGEQLTLGKNPAFKEWVENTPQTAQPLKGILKADTKPTPPNETWLKRTAASRRPSNPSPSTLAIEAQTPPDPAKRIATSFPQYTPSHLETALFSTPTEPSNPPMHTGFTPINKSKKPMFFMQPPDKALAINTDKADSSEMKVRRKPRHVDFAAITSPTRPKHINELGVTPRPKAKGKALSPAGGGKGERLTTEPPVVAQRPAVPRPEQHQQRPVSGDMGNPPKAAKHCAATPIAMPDRPWPPHANSQVLNAHNNHNKRESLGSNISTQAEVLKAQQLFQAEIPSPEKGLPYLPSLAPVGSLFGSKISGVATLTGTKVAPTLYPSSPPHQGDNTSADDRGDSPDTDVISTQELMDAISPFTFSTVKKRQRTGSFTKHASFTQIPSKQTSFALDGANGAFGKMGLDMETSPEIEDPGPPPQERKEKRAPTTNREPVTPTKAAPNLPNAVANHPPPSAASSIAAEKSPTKKFDDSNNSDSEEEMNNCIEDISNYLEGWDLEAELKRVAAAAKQDGGPAVTANKKGILSGGGWR